MNSGSLEPKPYVSPFLNPIEGHNPADSGEGAATLQATKEGVDQLHEKTIETPVELPDEKNPNGIPVDKKALSEGTSDSVPTRKSVGLLGTIWSSVNSVKNINKTFGETIPDKITHISIGKMLGNAISSVVNFNIKGTQSAGKAEKSQDPKKGTEDVGLESAGEESEIDDEETFEATQTLVKDMLKLAKEDPAAASQTTLTPKQWVALARADPNAAGKLLFDQSKQIEGGKEKDLSAEVKELGKKLTSTQLSRVASGAISREIERHPMDSANDITTLLRANTIGLNLFREFSQNHLNPVLKGTKEMKSVINLISSTPYEDKEGMKLGKGQDKKFRNDLSALMNQSYSFCINNQSQAMRDFRGILSQLDKDVKAKGGSDDDRADTVNRFFFLRFASPILYTPDAILGSEFAYPPKSESNKQTNGLNLSKVAQNMANYGDKMTQNSKLSGFTIALNQIGSQKLGQMNELKGKMMEKLREPGPNVNAI